jgi:4-amino-4-deoxy-L-arabinose transferase-like glycosyltransferase
MYHAPVTALRRHAGLRRCVVAAAMLFAFCVLAWDAQAFLGAALRAIRYPFLLDYGEGIVWQQAQQMRAGDAYGSIIGFPAIVFHYPPLYHAITLVVAGLSGLDMLMTGRMVSVAATLLTSLLAGLIASRTVRGELGRDAASLCGAVAALVTLTLWPVTSWGPLMRVDMVAMAFGFAGVWLAMQALSHIHISEPTRRTPIAYAGF